LAWVDKLLPWVNEAFIISSAIVMAFGWRQIRKGNETAHRRLMLTGSTLAALFFVSYVVKTVVVGDTSFGGPASWQGPYQVFLQIHSVLATVAAVLGVITLIFAFRHRFYRHRRVGPWTIITWFITAATGLMVFLLLYIIFPPGETTNMFRAWTGH
jgi:putative membrane protein